MRDLALKDEVVLRSLPVQEQEALMRTANRIWEESVEIAEKKNIKKKAKYENFKRKFRNYLLSLPKEFKVDVEQLQNGEYDDITSVIFNELTKQPPSDELLVNKIYSTLGQLGIVEEGVSSEELSRRNI